MLTSRKNYQIKRNTAMVKSKMKWVGGEYVQKGWGCGERK